jgi:hypothetical protein
VYKISVVNSEVKRPLGRPRRRWEDNIKMDLKLTEWKQVYWFNLAQGKDREFPEWLSYY